MISTITTLDFEQEKLYNFDGNILMLAENLFESSIQDRLTSKTTGNKQVHFASL